MIEKDKEKLDEVMHEKEIQTNALNGIKKLNDQDAEKEAQLIRTIKNVSNERYNISKQKPFTPNAGISVTFCNILDCNMRLPPTGRN